MSDTENAPVKMGTVKWFNITKGFGFIELDGNEGDVFVHHSAIKKDREPIREGMRVRFKIGQSPKGLRAMDVEAA